jgi:hypothetical protein
VTESVRDVMVDLRAETSSLSDKTEITESETQGQSALSALSAPHQRESERVHSTHPYSYLLYSTRYSQTDTTRNIVLAFDTLCDVASLHRLHMGRD